MILASKIKWLKISLTFSILANAPDTTTLEVLHTTTPVFVATTNDTTTSPEPTTSTPEVTTPEPTTSTPEATTSTQEQTTNPQPTASTEVTTTEPENCTAIVLPIKPTTENLECPVVGGVEVKHEIPLWVWVLLCVLGLIILLLIIIIIIITAMAKRGGNSSLDATSETSAGSVMPLIVGSQVANQEKMLPIIMGTPEPVASRTPNRAPPQLNANVLSHLKAPAFIPPVPRKNSSNNFNISIGCIE